MVAAFCMALSGFLLLCLAMERHRRQVGLETLSVAAVSGFRASGTLFLVASFFASGWSAGWGLALIAWPAMLTLAGLLVVGLIASVGTGQRSRSGAPAPSRLRARQR